MPERKTIKKAQQDKRRGKSASTQAGEFVKEEIDHIREGKHGAKNARQAIAIGLSKARASGVSIPDKKGKKAATSGHIHKKKVSAKRSRAGERRLKKESTHAASHRALSMAAHKAAKKRTRKANEKKAA
ncbi:MAG: DNA-binding protein [Bacteriovoracaceae bacterium]